MAERLTAEAQLGRILTLLPHATRAGGASLDELASLTGVDERELLRDLTAVYTRSYYRPAGAPEDVSVLIARDRVEVWTAGEFRRPPALNPRESVALGLGLRLLSTMVPNGGGPEADGYLKLARRLEGSLLAKEGAAGVDHFALHPTAPAPAARLAELARCARERRRCRIDYLRSGATEPEPREIDPYALLAAEGHWYALGHCHARDDIRVFRLDRVLDVAALDVVFETPPDFDPADHVSNGRVYRSDEAVEVTVEYSPRIARWLAEQGPVERLDDGSVRVRYSVADPGWVLRHVLEHGPDARVVAPAAIRDLVVAAIARLSGG